MSQSSGKTLLVAINISFILGMITHKLLFTGAPATVPAPVPQAQVKVADKQQATAVAQVVKKTVVKHKTAAVAAVTNKNFGKPLNYTGSVSGTIRGIPDSKLPTTGILVDMNTRKVLWSKNSKTAVPIASMTKMMTLLLAFEDIVDPRNDINIDTPVKITSSASNIGGSQVYLDPRETMSMEKLLQAIAIKSANDAAYQVAEFLGHGSVGSFVQRMNKRAKELGMNNTRFNNPHGLPETPSSRDNKSTPVDMVILAEQLLQYPDIVKLSSTYLTYLNDRYNYKTRKYDGKTQLVNTNRLVEANRKNGGVLGVDGMKTGYITRAGFCSTVTCKRGSRRLIAVVTGFKSSKSGRDPFVKKLLEWGYAR